ncbi:MAG: hypothetical protein WKF84_02080 [Pyrinomonadaceae bacterium]
MRVYPWAATGLISAFRDSVTNEPIFPTGLTWDDLDWDDYAKGASGQMVGARIIRRLS